MRASKTMIYTHALAYTRIHTRIYTHAQTHTYIHIHTCTTHTHIHTHTHTQNAHTKHTHAHTQLTHTIRVNKALLKVMDPHTSHPRMQPIYSTCHTLSTQALLPSVLKAAPFPASPTFATG